MKYLYLVLFCIVFISCKKEQKKENTVQEKSPIKEVLVDTPPIEEIQETPKTIFTVQIAALKNKSDEIARLPSVNTYQEDGLTKYRLGSFKTYREAREYRKRIITTYKDAFVQALKNDKPIPINEAFN